MPPEQFQKQLLAWFDIHGRKDLPWQQNISPYRVWLSEIMLQQTQVVSVIAYFNRFVTRFPTVQALAEAGLDEVLQHWAGLGYYARARNLHKTAQLIAGNNGEFPQTVEELSALPGIGRSTAGAILSIACGQSQSILDGNVKRVLTRFHGVRGWPGETKVATRLWRISSEYTPQKRCGDYTQAMMDLGATLCTRSKPRCTSCPVIDGCEAYKLNLTSQLPEPKPRKTLPVKQVFFLVLQDRQHRLLLERRPPAGIWGGLWSLPEFADRQQLRDWCLQQDYQLSEPTELPVHRHGFSHYQLEYIPILATLQNPINYVMEANSAVWYKPSDIHSLGLPAPVKRLLQHNYLEDHDDKND
ncbi:A/G-specific adenine glycosylase [Methylomonas methanica]|uniref:Adenine DNA glycosylase n=1 Tax=Methylomonas methanica (strain DSM 25384 / MC09) TaxID=857087 RepID=G0A1F9_METMM|nr:A/G-specific adenine glycosylase [Methylomonas methanica]AEF98852.1 A/G-specific adenine glycosylase [Methylomonas methanica MC09]